MTKERDFVIEHIRGRREANIVKRLVGLANSLGGDDEDIIMAGVAEIERLQSEVEVYKALVNEDLRADNERLRAALQSLTEDPPPTFVREPDTDAEVIVKMRWIARRALEPKP